MCDAIVSGTGLLVRHVLMLWLIDYVGVANLFGRVFVVNVLGAVSALNGGWVVCYMSYLGDVIEQGNGLRRQEGVDDKQLKRELDETAEWLRE
jgi:hypothetical protein